MYHRFQFDVLMSRLEEPRKFIQVIVGPRQVGKTTLVKQVLQACRLPYLHFSADNVPAQQTGWISDCWETARARMKAEQSSDFLLVIDEIQKISQWSEAVKKEWDADSWDELNLRVVLMGSSRVLLEKGLTESLHGRFEEIRMSHWSFSEMRDAFGLTLEQYIYYGGYPGAADLLADAERWENYVGSSIIDATINKDILQNNVITKPALLRQTFELGAAYSSRELSLTKMLGQLTDAGNTTTLASYLQLLSSAGMLMGIQKIAFDEARKRASAPKFQVYNNALRTIFANQSLQAAVADPKAWGAYFESAIGAHIVCHAFTDNYRVFYWRDGNAEVDYVIQKKDRVVAIEVKSNNEASNKGLQSFRARFHPYATLVVGKAGIPAETFLSQSPAIYFR